MSDLSTISTLVRYEIQDESVSKVPGDIFTYESSSVFTLSEPNVISVSEVLHNSAELGSGLWTFNSSRNQVTVTQSLSIGDTLEIQYSCYQKYSDTQIKNRIRSAIVYLSTLNYKSFIVNSSDNIFPTPTEEEYNILALVTGILLEPNNESYRLPDVTVNVPKSLPTRDLVAKTVALFKFSTKGELQIL